MPLYIHSPATTSPFSILSQLSKWQHNSSNTGQGPIFLMSHIQFIAVLSVVLPRYVSHLWTYLYVSCYHSSTSHDHELLQGSPKISLFHSNTFSTKQPLKQTNTVWSLLKNKDPRAQQRSPLRTDPVASLLGMVHTLHHDLQTAWPGYITNLLLGPLSRCMFQPSWLPVTTTYTTRIFFFFNLGF